MTEIEQISEDLFFKLRNRFPKLTMGGADGKNTTDPFSARFFNFTFEEEGKSYGTVTCSLVDEQSLKVFFSQDITEEMPEDIQDRWFAFLKELRKFAKSHMLLFDVRDITKPQLDQKDIEFLGQYTKKKNSLHEHRIDWLRRGQHSSGKMEKVRIHVIHKNKMDENPNNRLQQIDKIYLINSSDEKFLLPFKSILGAKAMAQYVARGGNPYDPMGQNISKAVGEMRNLQRFHMATRNKQYENQQTQNVREASQLIKEQIKKHLYRMANGRNFDESLDNINKLIIFDDPRASNDIKNWFVQKYYNENLNQWIESAAKAYTKFEEQKMSAVQEASASVQAKILNPNFKLILKKDPAIDQLIRNSKYGDQTGMITRMLSDIGERLIAPDSDDVANFAAKMAEEIAAEGTAFGTRMTDEYRKEKALAVRLVKRYIEDLNQMKNDPSYLDQVRKDPRETMGAKKDRYGKAKNESEVYEKFVSELGQIQEEPNEGNEFSLALKKAKEQGKEEFTVGDKTYKVSEQVNEAFDDYDELATELIKRHGSNITDRDIDAIEGERDSFRPLDRDELWQHIKYHLSDTMEDSDAATKAATLAGQAKDIVVTGAGQMKGRSGGGTQSLVYKSDGVDEAHNTDNELQELVLFADSDGDLYKRSTVPILKNLSRRWVKGQYDHDLATKLWKYHADRAAQEYARQYGSPNVKWDQMFSVPVRMAAARHWANEWKNELEASNLHEDNIVDEVGMNMMKFKKAFKGTGPEGSGDPRPMKQRLKDNPEFAKQVAAQTGDLGGMAELRRRIAKKLTKEEEQVDEKWGKPTVVSPNEKGKYEGKTKADLLKQYNKLKASGPHKKGSAEYGKMRELAFAIRAKSGWGKVESAENTETVVTESKILGDIKKLAGL